MIGKGAYLRQLTASTMPMRSVAMGKEVEGSTPPSVFIGSWNYPDIYAGPMVAPQHGDTMVMDMPEAWIPGNHSQEEIIGYRMNLIRGKQQVHAADLDTRFVEKLQEISLSTSSLESEVAFTAAPPGGSHSPRNTPPSGQVQESSGSMSSPDDGTRSWNARSMIQTSARQMP